MYFGTMKDDEDNSIKTGYAHQLAYGLLHRGQHRHGALPITDGER